jgi:hypothetical protein
MQEDWTLAGSIKNDDVAAEQCSQKAAADAHPSALAETDEELAMTADGMELKLGKADPVAVR